MTHRQGSIEERWIGVHVGGFVVTQFIDQGGMGAVYKAENSTLGTCRAIKILFDEAPDAAAISRFLDEARALSAVSHQGLVEVFDCGRLPDGTYFILMEFLRGESLRERLRREGRIPHAAALALLTQIAETLLPVHAQGIVHRDLKPSNIFLVPDDAAEGGTRTKLLDFGIARLRYAGAAHTKTGRRTGTPRYMSPEQCEGAAEISERSDVYALGLLITEVMTGSSPYPITEEEPLAWMFAHVRQRPRTLRQLVPKLPAELDELDSLVKRMLDKAPEQRPSTSEAVEILKRCAERTAAKRASGSRSDSWRSQLVSSSPSEALNLSLSSPNSTLRPAEVVNRSMPPRGRWGRRGMFGLGVLGVAVLAGAATGHGALGHAAPYAMLGAAHMGLGWNLLPRLLDDVDTLRGQKLTPPGMAFIPGAVFLMGSTKTAAEQDFADCQSGAKCRWECFARELHQRPVLVHSYYLDTTEVTNAAYAQWLNLHVRYDVRPQGEVLSSGQLLLDLNHTNDNTRGVEYLNGRFSARQGYEQKPVTGVSWYGARNYCRWRGGDLPTEAQWELAARGSPRRLLGRAPRFPWGNEPARCADVVVGRYPGGRCADQGMGMQPVGTAAQDVSPQGVHDLVGNANEWVWDVFKDPYPSCGWCIDPKYPEETLPDDGAFERVVRGASSLMDPLYGTTTGRSRHVESHSFDDTGFRCAATLQPSTP